ncbi:hypothetical protein M407DRAFT_27521 [Tulasnella calospora MUT 4182]|uniref:Protein kinase domain-containing protein n=1 Tax=Tulasnella calospora MUT 4182 TaxID=1051891 RepID=A0A0C3QCA2_9AGAM|nr:hypothetical protein M407DRAFT_27521 [Tulasnella calospora MUT 4182]
MSGSQNKLSSALMPPPTFIPVNRKPDPDGGADSLVQPGVKVQLPPELPGTLKITGDPLGKGSFATVFEGVLSSPGGETRTVAIKLVKLPGTNITHDQFRTRIKRETVIWTMVAHPNILPFIGYQIIDDSPLLVSPWCQNVHGDIKPENVIVQDNLVAALCDFGISKIHIEQHTGLTTSGVTGGTSGYQAKELLDESPATPATDVYAFGGLILAVSHISNFMKFPPE